MKIGRLRQRIVIEESIAGRDSFGAETSGWIQFAKVWADVAPVSGREFLAFKQINAEISTKVTIRYLAGVTTEMRVLFKDRIFEINSIINIEEKNVSLLLMCKEVA
ncbi:phage head closure protein [Gudongella oleilytica]|uniref:phage head closure protein n=1 Tax=Gudongella oleilytica TaxID=1582259 RepID=UPI0013E8E81E|nr:phage head closure protein [Gudongella oleilytica]